MLCTERNSTRGTWKFSKPRGRDAKDAHTWWLQRNDCFPAFESWVSCTVGIFISLPLEPVLNPEVCLQN